MGLDGFALQDGSKQELVDQIVRSYGRMRSINDPVITQMSQLNPEGYFRDLAQNQFAPFSSRSSNPKADTFSCGVCDRSFPGEAALQQHAEATGHGQFVWNCGECQREFASEKQLDQHQQATGHVDPACKVCGKAFGSMQAMLQHAATSAKCKQSSQ